MFGPVLMLAAATSDPGGASQLRHAVASAAAAVPDSGAIDDRLSAGCEQATRSLVAETSLPSGTRFARLRNFNLHIDLQESHERQASRTIAATSFPIEDPGTISRIVARIVRPNLRTVPLEAPAAARARSDAPAVVTVVSATVSMSAPVQKPVAVVARPPVAEIYDLNPAAKTFENRWRARGKAAVIAIDKFEASPSSDALPSEAGHDVNLFLPLRDKVTLAGRKTQVTLVWSVRKENRADGLVELRVNGLRARAVIRVSSGSMVAQRLSLSVPATAVRFFEGLSIKAWIRVRRGTKRSVSIVSVDAMEIEAIP